MPSEAQRVYEDSSRVACEKGALPLKQLQKLGKRESQLRRSSRVIERYAQAERKHVSISEISSRNGINSLAELK
jgi:hypothetical protein